MRRHILLNIYIHSCSTTDDTMIITNDNTVGMLSDISSSNTLGGLIMNSYIATITCFCCQLISNMEQTLTCHSFHIQGHHIIAY